MARPIAVIDSETDPFVYMREPRPFIWGFYDGEDYREFTDTGALVDFLSEKRLVVYAHNGGRFDYHFLLDYMEPYSEIMIINGRIAKFTIGACEFRDSINILPVALKEYKKDDLDYTILEADKRALPENAAKISAYLKSDCVYLYELVSGFVQNYGMQLTQASAAMNQWKKIYQRKPPKTPASFYNYLKPFYQGGRVEVFKRGVIEKPFNVYDINSAYPFAMLHRHAFSPEFFEVDGRPETITPQEFYNIEAVSFGALPHTDERGKLTFPNDTQTRAYHVTGWELLAGLETGTVFPSHWDSYITFPETVDFTEYVQKFWEMRLKAKAEGNKAQDLWAKLFLNGLYGKWGANPQRYRRHLIVPADEFSEGETVEYLEGDYTLAGSLGPWLLGERQLREDEQRYYNVATAASITGFVRAHLWRAIHSCGLEQILYCDTDSIATHASGTGVVEGSALGQWKNEGAFSKAAIAGKKLYAFWPTNPDSKVKKACKGGDIAPAEIERVARGEKVTYYRDAPTFSIKSGLRFVKRDIIETF